MSNVLPLPNERNYYEAARLVKDGAAKWSAQDAAIVLANCAYDQNRHKTVAGKAHAEMLGEMMRRGKWRPKDVLHFGVLPDGRAVLLNGHHRLTAQRDTGCTIEWMVVVHMCASMEDVERLYWSFDTSTRLRTNQTILAGINFAEKLGTSKAVAEAMFRAAPYISAGLDFSREGQSNLDKITDRRLEVAMQFAPEAALYDAAIANATPKMKNRLLTIGAISVAVVSLKYQRDRAIPFWKGVADNDGLQRLDPRHTYHTFLMERVPKKGMAVWTANAAATAWHYWFHGKPLASIRQQDKPRVSVAGAPALYRG